MQDWKKILIINYSIYLHIKFLYLYVVLLTLIIIVTEESARSNVKKDSLVWNHVSENHSLP